MLELIVLASTLLLVSIIGGNLYHIITYKEADDIAEVHINNVNQANGEVYDNKIKYSVVGLTSDEKRYILHVPKEFPEDLLDDELEACIHRSGHGPVRKRLVNILINHSSH